MTVADTLERAEALKTTDKPQAISLLHDLVHLDLTDEEGLRAKETAILELGELLAAERRADELVGLIKFTRPFLARVSKAKAAKLVRQLVDQFLDLEAGTGQEVALCKECIEWAADEKRAFLRQALEARLVALYHDTGRYEEALALGSGLLRELKKLDDKLLLVEVQLLESKVYHALGNLPKARAALTSGRTTANGVYCPPRLQATLDQQSGVLHAAEEKDFKTAFSYFYEAFEGYDSVGQTARALTSLKYMLLCKVMLNQPDDVASIVSGKLALRYTGIHVDAMRAVAAASQKRSLADFQAALAAHPAALQEDGIVRAHLDALYDHMLEQNLCRLIEPFSKVQVEHVAQLIKLPRDVVERKLSQMILDKKFSGILDQGTGVLDVLDDTPVDKTYTASLDTITNLGKVVDALYNKAKKLS